jgi:hypothetical protein
MFLCETAIRNCPHDLLLGAIASIVFVRCCSINNFSLTFCWFVSFVYPHKRQRCSYALPGSSSSHYAASVQLLRRTSRATTAAMGRRSEGAAGGGSRIGDLIEISATYETIGPQDAACVAFFARTHIVHRCVQEADVHFMLDLLRDVSQESEHSLGKCDGAASCGDRVPAAFRVVHAQLTCLERILEKPKGGYFLKKLLRNFPQFDSLFVPLVAATRDSTSLRHWATHSAAYVFILALIEHRPLLRVGNDAQATTQPPYDTTALEDALATEKNYPKLLASQTGGNWVLQGLVRKRTDLHSRLARWLCNWPCHFLSAMSTDVICAILSRSGHEVAPRALAARYFERQWTCAETGVPWMRKLVEDPRFDELRRVLSDLDPAYEAEIARVDREAARGSHRPDRAGPPRRSSAKPRYITSAPVADVSREGGEGAKGAPFPFATPALLPDFPEGNADHLGIDVAWRDDVDMSWGWNSRYSQQDAALICKPRLQAHSPAASGSFGVLDAHFDLDIANACYDALSWPWEWTDGLWLARADGPRSWTGPTHDTYVS